MNLDTICCAHESTIMCTHEKLTFKFVNTEVSQLDTEYIDRYLYYRQSSESSLYFSTLPQPPPTHTPPHHPSHVTSPREYFLFRRSSPAHAFVVICTFFCVECKTAPPCFPLRPLGGGREAKIETRGPFTIISLFFSSPACVRCRVASLSEFPGHETTPKTGRISMQHLL